MPCENLHVCYEIDWDGKLNLSGAVIVCMENEDGTLVAGCDDTYYQSQVNYCPYCGFKAAQPLVKVAKNAA